MNLSTKIVPGHVLKHGYVLLLLFYDLLFFSLFISVKFGMHFVMAHACFRSNCSLTPHNVCAINLFRSVFALAIFFSVSFLPAAKKKQSVCVFNKLKTNHVIGMFLQFVNLFGNKQEQQMQTRKP